uniref:Uncharacterized protein n=1 Tax=Rhizophora mucronata TaxID=61149 RepID=A0A2P2IWW3_RHIMU
MNVSIIETNLETVGCYKQLHGSTVIAVELSLLAQWISA